MKKKYSDLQRILRIINFYHNRGVNSERVNAVYRKINLINLKKKLVVK